MSGFSFGSGVSTPPKSDSRDDIIKIFTKMCVEVLHMVHLENIRVINRNFGTDFYNDHHISKLDGPYYLYDGHYKDVDFDNMDFDIKKMALMNLEQAFHYPFRLVGFTSEPKLVLKDIVDDFLKKIEKKTKMSGSFSYRMLHGDDEFRELSKNTNNPSLVPWILESREKLNIDELKELIFELAKPDHQKSNVTMRMTSDSSLIKLPCYRVLMKCRLFIRLIGLIGGLAFGTFSIGGGDEKKELGTEVDFDDIIFDALVNDTRMDYTGYEILEMNNDALDKLSQSYTEKHKRVMNIIDEILSFFDNLLKEEEEGAKIGEKSSETTSFI